MRVRMIRRCFVLAAAVGLALPVTAVSAGGATATPVKKPVAFKITKIRPNPAVVILNGAHKTIIVRWSGKATFPMVVHFIPKPGCSTKHFTCHPGAVPVKKAGHRIRLKNAASCSGGGLKSAYTSHYSAYLEDSKDKKTPSVPFALTCKP
jgi:hypothetical protein